MVTDIYLPSLPDETNVASAVWFHPLVARLEIFTLDIDPIQPGLGGNVGQSDRCWIAAARHQNVAAAGSS